MTRAWQKILLTLAILGLISSGMVACYGFNHIEEWIEFFSEAISSTALQSELKPEYTVEQYLKDLYVWIGIWFDITLFLLSIGCVGLIFYLSLRIWSTRKKSAATNSKQ